MKTYAGIDLHSSNNYIGVIDAKDKRLYSKRHDNRIEDILKVLGKFKATLQGIVVESTYNWYWLVDGLMDQDYTVHLANPNAIKAYDGLKHTDDKWDSFWLAHLLRLGILPEGYIYPPLTHCLNWYILFDISVCVCRILVCIIFDGLLFLSIIPTFRKCLESPDYETFKDLTNFKAV